MGESYGSNPFDTLDAVLYGNHQPQRRAVCRTERLIVHRVTKQRLRMGGAGSIKTDVVSAIGCFQADVFRRHPEFVQDIRQFRSGPMNDMTPSFNASEFGNHIDPRKGMKISQCKR